jgi:lysine N6-hydroxylase
MHTTVHDFIGIGIGPFNLGLACLVEPLQELDALFFDQRAGFDWHPGMLLEGAGMQTPFLADLVTLADPTSPYSFLNYLKKSGRLYPFYIRENFFPLRAEFNAYCQWAAGQLSSLRFNRRIERLYHDAGVYRLEVRNTLTGALEHYAARRLVLGTGTEPSLPACCDKVRDKVLLSADYVGNKARLQMQPSITVLGSGQSAAEIYYDLLQDIDRFGYELDWITRSPRFFPLEYTRLTLEMTSPEYIDYFHALAPQKRDRLIGSQKGLYKGINRNLIDAIHELLYRKSLDGMRDTRLLTNTTLTGCRYDASRERFELDLLQHEQGVGCLWHTSALVVATGYEYREPAFLAGIEHRLRRDAAGRLDVTRNYSVDAGGSEVFVQNVGLHTHGLATPDLGMACYRNACILRGITGRDVYPVENRIAFQSFGLADTTTDDDVAWAA